MRRRKLTLLVYLFGLSVMLTPAMLGCAPTASSTLLPAASTSGSSQPYTIGFVNSFTGYYAPLGRQEREAVAMLEEKTNKEGGINGRNIKIIYYDDESEESGGVLALKKLINDDKVLGIIGTAASGVALAESPIAEDGQTPFVAMNSSYAVLTNPPKKWVFKVASSEKFLVGGIYRYLKSKGITNFAWLSQRAGFGLEARKYLQETYQKEGFTLAATEEYNPTDNDARPQLAKIKASNPQALVVYGAEAAGAIAIRQAREIGIKAPVLGPPSLTVGDPKESQQLREGMEGAIFVAFKPDMWQQLPDSDLQKRVNEEFDKAMRARYGSDFRGLEWPMGVGYDGFTVMVNALKKANPDTSKLEDARARIREALEQTRGYVGSFGMLDQGPTEHEGLSWNSMVIAQMQGGKYKLLK